MRRTAKHFFNSTTTKLATTYLAIIMLMSIGFSVVFYNASSHALSRQVPRNDFSFQTTDQNGQQQPPTQQIHDFLSERAAEGRRALLIRLVVLNCSALVAGGIISYYLARRTLQPIEEAMEAQAQFVSDASHELRTPLTSIQTSNEVSLRNKKLTLAQAKAVIRDNTEEAIKLKTLSDGLLNLAKQGRAQQTLSTVSVQSAVSSAVNQVIPMAQQKNISIEDETANEAVTSDQHVLSQILVILLDNAIKYSHDGGIVCVTSSRKNNFVLLHVVDEGVGIRASDLPHVFRRFYRTDAARSDSHREGYGLGLAIAETLANTHEASLSVESQIGSGTTFTLKLRLAKKA